MTVTALAPERADLAARAARWSRRLPGGAEHARLVALVHDEVLATLSLAAQGEGPLAPSLVVQARGALAAVRGQAHPAPGAAVPGEALGAEILARVGDRAAVRVTGSRSADVPREVCDAVLAALDEAVRNSVRHAGSTAAGRPVARRVAVTLGPAALVVTVSDDGVGFDPDGVDPRRLGVRRSIVERMATVRGGAALVASEPGVGTVVTLFWRLPRAAVPTALAADTRAAGAAEASELRAIVAPAEPLLERIAAGGALTAAERTAARLLEARLRDRIRARALAREPLASACDAARRAGSDVLLLDDGDGSPSLPAPVLARIAALVATVAGGRVTVRVLPAGREALVTVLVDQDGQVHAHALGPAGTAVHAGR